MDQPPTKVPLLTIYDLLRPVEEAKSVVADVHRRAELNGGPIDEFSLKGWFVLMMASFEGMISELLETYLLEHPQRLPKEEFAIHRDELICTATTFRVLEKVVERHVQNLSYDALYKQLKTFFGYLTIKPYEVEEDMQWIQEAKERRNLILHRNSRVSSRYEERAGPKGKRQANQSRIQLDADYLVLISGCLTRFLEHVESEIKSRFSGLTRLAALRSLWAYVFATPLMPFDDYWVVDENEDRIVRAIVHEDPGSTSSSEWRFYKLWLANYCGEKDHLVMRSLTDTDKLVWLLEQLRHISPGGTYRS